MKVNKNFQWGGGEGFKPENLLGEGCGHFLEQQIIVQ